MRRQAALLACIRNNKLITKSARVDSAKLIRGSARVEKKKRLRDSDGRKTGASSGSRAYVWSHV